LTVVWVFLKYIYLYFKTNENDNVILYPLEILQRIIDV